MLLLAAETVTDIHEKIEAVRTAEALSDEDPSDEDPVDEEDDPDDGNGEQE